MRRLARDKVRLLQAHRGAIQLPGRINLDPQVLQCRRHEIDLPMFAGDLSWLRRVAADDEPRAGHLGVVVPAAMTRAAAAMVGRHEDQPVLVRARRPRLDRRQQFADVAVDSLDRLDVRRATDG